MTLPRKFTYDIELELEGVVYTATAQFKVKSAVYPDRPEAPPPPKKKKKKSFRSRLREAVRQEKEKEDRAREKRKLKQRRYRAKKKAHEKDLQDISRFNPRRIR